ncbi:MAG TPA: hypothetical protein PK156_29300, partial [Polyangium sp.]|nr:hypothetical protein [Polyangium sp.]
MLKWSLLALLLGGLGASCGDRSVESGEGQYLARSDSVTTLPVDLPRGGPRISAPLDLAGVMRRVHFSFRADEAGEFSGGHTSYEVRTSAMGISITPGRTDGTADTKTSGARAEEIGAPVYFETEFWGRGADLHASALGEPRVAEDGHLILPRGEIDEEIENTEDGADQRFMFSQRPQGQGDLVIQVRVSGEEYVGETEWGHHFVDAETGIGVRYGLATWIDASGKQTVVRVDYRDDLGDLVLTVPHEVVEASTYPAVLDPIILPEFGMDNPVQGSVTNAQAYPHLAFDGTNNFVVWRDLRFAGKFDVMGAFVTPAGALLSPGGILVNPTLMDGKPSVAFNGTNYLVTWAQNSSLYGRLVSPAGTLVTPLTSLANVTNVRAPEVAAGGGNFLLVYNTGADQAWGIRVTGMGVSVGSPFYICGTATTHRNPAVAFDGTNYLVVWEDNRSGSDIYGARITTAGTNLNPTGFPISTAVQAQTDPKVAFDGLNYLVVWSDSRWGNADIYGTRVDQTGLILDPANLEISKTVGAQTVPNVAFDGTRYVVAWADARGANTQIFASRVLPAGIVVDTNGIQATSYPTNTDRPALACSTSNCLIAYEDYRFANADIRGVRLNSAGSVLDADGFLISTTGNNQASPSVAWGNGQILAVWEDSRNGNTDIYGARLSTNSTVLDPNGIVIASGTSPQVTPVVNWNGTEWVVVWSDKRNGLNYDIYGTNVQSDGTVVAPMGVAISTAAGDQLRPAMEFDGTYHLVVWEDYRANNWDIYGARVSPAMNVLETTGMVIEGTTTAANRPKLAFDGTRYMVVWSGKFNRVTPAGSVLDGNGLALPASMTSPNVAYDGLNFFVINSGGNNAVRVTGNGALVDATPFNFANTGTDSSTIIRHGPGVFVATRLLQAGLSSIYGTWVSQDGSASHPTGLQLSSIMGSNHFNPALTGDGMGHLLVAYDRLETSGLSSGHQRVHARHMTALVAGQACGGAIECLSGFCVDGVCCNTACGNGNPNDCLGCSVAAGASANGSCSALDAVPCSDGNSCTANDMCMSGTCTGSPVVCTATDSCHVAGTCNTATGICTNPAKPNGSVCDDGNACTQTSTCQTGTCVGTNPVVCPMDTECTNVSACDPLTGVCAVTNETDGSACNDGNACTQMSTCQAGQCVGSNPVTCAPPATCKQAGTCNPATGQCTYSDAIDGTTCDDGNACTQMSACQAGQCVGSNPVTCAPPATCKQAGTCNPATGQCTY